MFLVLLTFTSPFRKMVYSATNLRKSQIMCHELCVNSAWELVFSQNILRVAYFSVLWDCICCKGYDMSAMQHRFIRVIKLAKSNKVFLINNNYYFSLTNNHNMNSQCTIWIQLNQINYWHLNQTNQTLIFSCGWLVLNDHLIWI